MFFGYQRVLLNSLYYGLSWSLVLGVSSTEVVEKTQDFQSTSLGYYSLLDWFYLH